MFSCFHGGGGSSMGWKLAGFDVVGGVEIDERMMSLYRRNLRPAHSFRMGVSDFVAAYAGKPPPGLGEIDVLDGSPPCSTFSTAGLRSKAWGVKKRFREGQAVQVLDDLFGQFIQVADVLRPRVVIAENVAGMLNGNAKGYVREIFRLFSEIGYEARLFLLNAARMGVPQRRERVFFVATRESPNPVSLSYDESPIPLADAFSGLPDQRQLGARLPPRHASSWRSARLGYSYSSHGQAFKGHFRCDPRLPSPTLTATPTLQHWAQSRYFSPREAARIQTFPDDYDFTGEKAWYVCGMSVPPRMMQRVASEVCRQVWPDRYRPQPPMQDAIAI